MVNMLLLQTIRGRSTDVPRAPFNDPHALAAHEVASQLGVDVATGLDASAVTRNRARHGENVLPRGASRGFVRMFAEQFLNIIVLLLVVAAAISWLTGEAPQAVAIVVVLLINSLVGAITEWQSGRALEALSKETPTNAHVIRDGATISIPARELAVGDVVLLSAGDRVPADLRVVEATALRALESSLTGESGTVEKRRDAVPETTRVAERSSMLYLGTVITAGRGVGIVVATGATTELGRIGRLVSAIDATPTTLQRRLDAMGHRLVWLVLVIALIVTVAGLLRGEPLWRMIETGISLAVAAVPEALPAVTSFILAFGVLRMSRRRAIVRRLSAVETLGSTTVICSDKTGTLTLNRMTVTQYWLPDETYVDVDSPRAHDAALVAALCNDATALHGDPTESALVIAAERLGIDVAAERARMRRVGEHPFDSTSKRMITMHESDSGERVAFLKGAPAVVAELCAADADEKKRIDEANAAMASRGLRVLALARWDDVAFERAESPGYTFVGLVGMLDPPRPGVIEAIGRAREAGIRVVMLTGDQVETARSISRELHLADAPRVRHASELDSVAQSELAALVCETDAFARVSPEEKHRIVAALQDADEVVAVTGDGVNDAPALKKADVGVAMGERGTEVAKEAADIVLTDDNFASIVAAVEGGRTIYENIIKFVHQMFSHNLAEVLMIFFAILAGWPLPLLPLQILWLNIATDIFPSFGLALEPPADDVMTRRPRPMREGLLTRSMLITVGWQGAMLATLALGIYWWALRTYGEGAHARTVALLAIVGVQIGQTFNCRSRRRLSLSGITRSPHIAFATATVIGLQFAVSEIAALREILGLVPPNFADVAAALIAVIVPVVIVDVSKLAARRVA